MNTILMALLSLLGLLAGSPEPPPTAAASVQSDPLEGVAWLAGCWESRAGNRTVLEMWSPPDGGMMVGANRTVSGDRVRAFEHLRIQTDSEGGIVYIAIPSGQVETHFQSTRLDEMGFLVENPEHDFPQRISYRRSEERPDGAFLAVVEARGEDGEMRGFSMAFERVPCASR